MKIDIPVPYEKLAWFKEKIGFGLPIARLAARKNLREMRLEPVPGQAVRCLVHLPLPERFEEPRGRSEAPPAHEVHS